MPAPSNQVASPPLAGDFMLRLRDDLPDAPAMQAATGDHPIGQRIAALDNAKAILAGLVVFGHLIEVLPNRTISDSVYSFLYLFHMPAFVALSGHLARNKTRITHLLDISVRFALSYLVFQAVYALERGARFQVSYPFWLLWYLPSLIGWHWIRGIFEAVRVRGWHALLLSAAIGLVAGVLPVGYDWSASRTLVFLPFFVAGACLTAAPPRTLRFTVFPLSRLTGLDSIIPRRRGWK